MRVYEVGRESNYAECEGLTFWDEFLPYVRLDVDSFMENNSSLKEPKLGEEPKSLSGTLNILTEEQKKVYTIVTDEDETIIPLVIEKGSDKNMDEDGIIEVCADKKVEGISFEKESFETSVGSTILLKVTKTDPTLEDEIELRLVANDDPGYIGEEGELEDVLCGRVIVKFKKSIEYVSLDMKFNNLANNEPLARAMVQSYTINGAFTYQQNFAHGQKCPQSSDDLKKKQTYLKHLGLYTDDIDGDIKNNPIDAFNTFWSNRGYNVDDFTDGQLLNGIELEEGNMYTDENGEMKFKILKSALINADTTLTFQLNDIDSSLSNDNFSESIEIHIKKQTESFESFDGDDVNSDGVVEINVNAACICNRGMTLVDLENLAPNAIANDRSTYLDAINLTCNEFEIHTCIEKAHFIAQLLTESANLSATKEFGVSNTSYGGYPGRGLIQLTYKSTYRGYEQFVGTEGENEQNKTDDFTSSLTNKEKLEQLPHAALSAGWFYRMYKGGILSASREDDILEVTARINGGFNGFNDRKNKLTTCKAYLKTLCSNSQLDSDTYNYEDSRIYNNRTYTFGWAIYHDTKFTCKTGVTKDNDGALVAYQRFQSFSNTSSLKNTYQIATLSEFSEYRKTETNGKGVEETVVYFDDVVTDREGTLNPPENGDQENNDQTNTNLQNENERSN